MVEKLNIISKLRPEIKTRANQEEKTRSVWPMSGCIINRKDMGKIERKLKKYFK